MIEGEGEQQTADAAQTPASAGGTSSGGGSRAGGKKQAVLLVHGIGEQIPMETLRGFVETMWEKDPRIGKPDNPVWFKPDQRDDSSELWRIATKRAETQASPPSSGPAGTGQRTDFFELYWADLTASNTLDQLNNWFWFLLWRKRSDVPGRVLAVWRILWVSAVVIAFFLVWQGLATAKLVGDLPKNVGYAIAGATLIYGLVIKIVISYVGDVATYCRAKPVNIAARRGVRARGLARLKAIADSGDYDRVILVGHSLGSIVAYDVLKLYWAEWTGKTPIERPAQPGTDLYTALIAARSAAETLEASPSQTGREVYREAQTAVFDAAQTDPRPQAFKRPDAPFTPWVVSDFVTVGAALSHAEFLMANTPKEFKKGKIERRFPAIPPVADGTIPGSPNTVDYLYFDTKADALKIDFAAVFSAVRWTNIHDDAKAILFGDIVSGPCAKIFGEGVLDAPVKIKRRFWLARFFTHTLYWTDTRRKSDLVPVHLDQLRKALNLARVSPPPLP